jgi:hypothetical protein
MFAAPLVYTLIVGMLAQPAVTWGHQAHLFQDRMKGGRERRLVAVAGTNGNALTTLGAAAGQHRGSGFGLHTRQETVGLGPMTAVRLKCALWHNTALLILRKNFCLEASFKYNGLRRKRQGLGGSRGKIGGSAFCFHYRWCNSGGKEIFALNTRLRRLVTVLVSAPIKIDFLHVHTT